MNFGWVGILPNYLKQVKTFDKENNTGGTQPHSFDGILNYLIVELQNEYQNTNDKNLNILSEFFKNTKVNLNEAFSNFVHNKYPAPNVFLSWKPSEFKFILWNTCKSLQPIRIIYEFICNLHRVDLHINNIDVMKLLDNELSILKNDLFMHNKK